MEPNTRITEADLSIREVLLVRAEDGSGVEVSAVFNAVAGTLPYAAGWLLSLLDGGIELTGDSPTIFEQPTFTVSLRSKSSSRIGGHLIRAISEKVLEVEMEK